MCHHKHNHMILSQPALVGVWGCPAVLTQDKGSAKNRPAALVKITCEHVEMFNNNKTGMFSQIIFRPVRPRVVCLLDFLKSY